MEKFRHEIKYLCSEAELEEIKLRISTVAEADSNALDGKYLIRSVYFDDYYNSYFYDNESGVNPREKWRIRAYNSNSKVIVLEKKSKVNGMINKQSSRISLEEFDKIIKGDMDIPIDPSREVLNRFNILRQTRLLQPVVIVQYERFPFIYKEGNVRVTLDCNISSSKQFDKFFDSSLSTRPIQPGKQQLLEVKYDEFLPKEIFDSVQLKNMTQQTFSKYYLCRKFGMEG